MFERLDLQHIVRYLFGGTIAAGGLLLANDISLAQVRAWLTNNPWATEPGPATALIVLLFVAGFSLFTVYRGFIYERILIWLKGKLEDLLGIYTYRTYIRDLFAKYGAGSLNANQAEHIYAFIKVTKLKDFYRETGAPITTSLHFLYYSIIVILFSSLSRPIELWYVILGLLILFAVVLSMDWNFEAIELLVFRENSEAVEAAVKGLCEKRVLPIVQRQTVQAGASTNQE